MKVYMLQFTQSLPGDLEKVWDFFSSPGNLKLITPQYMDFIVTSNPEDKTYPGQVITYKVKPLLAIPVLWVTEIKHAVPYEYFIDEQRFGPYKFWHHKHSFAKTGQGVEMTDIIHYALPFGILGRIVNALIVRKKILEIFEHRRKKVDEIFRK
jgi:ligand-binding SRPBCC domain-containing protein